MAPAWTGVGVMKLALASFCLRLAEIGKSEKWFKLFLCRRVAGRCMVPGAIGCSGRMKFYVREFCGIFRITVASPCIMQGRRLPEGRGDLGTAAQDRPILEML